MYILMAINFNFKLIFLVFCFQYLDLDTRGHSCHLIGGKGTVALRKRSVLLIVLSNDPLLISTQVDGI